MHFTTSPLKLTFGSLFCLFATSKSLVTEVSTFVTWMWVKQCHNAICTIAQSSPFCNFVGAMFAIPSHGWIIFHCLNNIWFLKSHDYTMLSHWSLTYPTNIPFIYHKYSLTTSIPLFYPQEKHLSKLRETNMARKPSIRSYRTVNPPILSHIPMN